MTNLNRSLLALTLGISAVALQFTLNPNASFADLPVNQNYFQGPMYTPSNNLPPVNFAQPETNTPPVEMMQPSEQPELRQPVVTMPPSPPQPPVNRIPVSNNNAVILQSHPAEAQIANGFHITFQTPFNSTNAQDGDAFIATAGEDLWVQNQLLVPRGSVIRGRIVTANKKGIFGAGGELTLDFDHIVMPDGTLKNISYQMTPTPTAGSRSNQLANSYEEGREVAQAQTQRGVEYAKSKGGGVNYLLAVPTNALLGVASGTLITTRGVTKAIFGKADSIVVNPGDDYVIQYNEAARIFR